MSLSPEEIDRIRLKTVALEKEIGRLNQEANRCIRLADGLFSELLELYHLGVGTGDLEGFYAEIKQE